MRVLLPFAFFILPQLAIKKTPSYKTDTCQNKQHNSENALSCAQNIQETPENTEESSGQCCKEAELLAIDEHPIPEESVFRSDFIVKIVFPLFPFFLQRITPGVCPGHRRLQVHRRAPPALRFARGLRPRQAACSVNPGISLRSPGDLRASRRALCRDTLPDNRPAIRAARRWRIATTVRLVSPAPSKRRRSDNSARPPVPLPAPATTSAYPSRRKFPSAMPPPPRCARPRKPKNIRAAAAHAHHCEGCRYSLSPPEYS